jgi:hypothetical protein
MLKGNNVKKFLKGLRTRLFSKTAYPVMQLNREIVVHSDSSKVTIIVVSALALSLSLSLYLLAYRLCIIYGNSQILLVTISYK